MDMRAEIAKFLMVIGAVIFAVGLIVLVAPKIPWIGRLPGDIDIKGKNFRIYFPIITCIVLSILLTLLLNLINIFRR
jgi:ribose/xylose/arabinose/galactoside ABC-type transport system permease subunit